MEEMEQKLKDLNIKVQEENSGGCRKPGKDWSTFFNNLDVFMIEICNCENLKLVLTGSLGKIKLPFDRHNLLEINTNSLVSKNF